MLLLCSFREILSQYPAGEEVALNFLSIPLASKLLELLFDSPPPPTASTIDKYQELLQQILNAIDISLVDRDIAQQVAARLEAISQLDSYERVVLLLYQVCNEERSEKLKQALQTSFNDTDLIHALELCVELVNPSIVKNISLNVQYLLQDPRLSSWI